MQTLLLSVLFALGFIGFVNVHNIYNHCLGLNESHSVCSLAAVFSSLGGESPAVDVVVTMVVVAVV